MAFALTYQDYASSHPQDNGGSEGGQGTSSLMPEDQWNSLTTAQQWQQVGNGIAIFPNDPRYADIAKGLDMSGGDGSLAKVILVGPGSQYKPGMLVNEKNTVDLGDGVNATNWGNFTPIGQRSDTSSNFFHQEGPGLLLLGAIFTGGALAGAGAFGAAAEGGVAGGAAGVSGSSALATGGFGTDIAAGSGAFSGAAGGVAGGAGAGAGSGSGGFQGPSGVEEPPPPGAGEPPPGGAPGPGEPGFQGPSGVEEPPPTGAPDPGLPPGTQPPAPVTETGTYPPGTQAPAPVSEAAPPVGTQSPAPVTDASVPSNGIVNSAANGASTSNSLMPQWYNNLSPGARQILGLGLSTAGRAAITSLAQQRQIDAQRQIVDQHRQDVIRQGQVPVLPPNTFTARPGGIINNASNNGGSGP